MRRSTKLNWNEPIKTNILVAGAAVLLTVIAFSCKSKSRYPVSIESFREPIRSHLADIACRGIVMNGDSLLSGLTTDEDLNNLCRSEQATLRATAFREMMNRKSFNHFEILLSHLDDTARIRVDAGEFGVWSRAVSDDLIQEYKWASEKEKDLTIEDVLLKHAYLRSAYEILSEISPQEKYYSIIKQMAVKSPTTVFSGVPIDFSDREHALYGLAKFKRPEDIPLISKELDRNAYRISYLGFRIMEEFPDSSYFTTLSRFHRRKFYHFNGNRQGGFSGFPTDPADPEDFIRALVAQRSSQSAQLLDTMLSRIPLETTLPDRGYINENLVTAIWNTDCPVYSRLRNRIKKEALALQKNQLFVESSLIAHTDSVDRAIRW